MKKFLFSLMLLMVTLCTISCKDNDSVVQDVKEKEWTTEKQGDVVYVENGNDSFFMNYLLYQSLMSRGGYTAVHNHYTSTPSLMAEQSTLKNNYNSYYNKKPIVKSDDNNIIKKPITSNNNSVVSNSKYTKPITYRKPTITNTYKFPSKTSSNWSSSKSSSSYKPSSSSSSSSSWSSRSSSSSYRSSSYRSSSRR